MTELGHLRNVLPDALCHPPGGLRDLLAAYHLDSELAHEASLGAHMQAAWLEECANNNPEPAKRRELLRRPRAAQAAGDKLRAVS